MPSVGWDVLLLPISNFVSKRTCSHSAEGCGGSIVVICIPHENGQSVCITFTTRVQIGLWVTCSMCGVWYKWSTWPRFWKGTMILHEAFFESELNKVCFISASRPKYDKKTYTQAMGEARSKASSARMFHSCVPWSGVDIIVRPHPASLVFRDYLGPQLSVHRSVHPVIVGYHLLTHPIYSGVWRRLGCQITFRHFRGVSWMGEPLRWMDYWPL